MYIYSVLITGFLSFSLIKGLVVSMVTMRRVSVKGSQLAGGPQTTPRASRHTSLKLTSLRTSNKQKKGRAK